MNDLARLTNRVAATATVAKNVALARSAASMTQAVLALAAGVSRATIAQVESGDSDPRLSTLIDIATGLGTSPVLLLLGEDELRALVEVTRDGARSLLSDAEVGRTRRLLSSGLRKQRLQAGDLGAAAARAAGLSAVGAAIGTVLLPGIGTAMGAAIGTFLLARARRLGAKGDDD